MLHASHSPRLRQVSPTHQRRCRPQKGVRTKRRDPQASEASSDCSQVDRSKNDQGAVVSAQVENLAPAKQAITAASGGQSDQIQGTLSATAISTDPRRFRSSSIASSPSGRPACSKPAELSMTKKRFKWHPQEQERLPSTRSRASNTQQNVRVATECRTACVLQVSKQIGTPSGAVPVPVAPPRTHRRLSDIVAATVPSSERNCKTRRQAQDRSSTVLARGDTQHYSHQSE